MRKRIYSTNRKKVTAAEEEFDGFEDFEEVEDPETFSDDIQDVADAVEDLQDVVEDEDDPVDTILETDNNIEDHYIAECDHCHEIFISAVVESDNPVESIFGECPLCHEESDQHLKWIIKTV